MKKLITLVCAVVFMVGLSVAQERGGRPGAGQNRTPEEMAKTQVERLTTELKLSQEQQDSIYKYTLEASKEQQALMQNSGDDREAAFEKMRSIQEKNSGKIKTFLTDEQATKYDKLQSEMQQRRRPSN